MKKKYKPGDSIEHKKFGKGTVKKIDPKDFTLYCLIEFDDGAKMWIAKWMMEKEVKFCDN